MACIHDMGWTTPAMLGIRFGPMLVVKLVIYRRNKRLPKPYDFIGFGDMDVTKPFESIWFGDIHGPEPYLTFA